MNRIIKIIFIAIFFSLILMSQESNNEILFYKVNGEVVTFDFEDIESLSIDKIDSLSLIHVFYKNKAQHFIYSCKKFDSIKFNHNENAISIINEDFTEIHSIDDIKNIKINCDKLIIPHDSTIGYSNPDSVMVDSCQNPPVTLVNRWFFVIFDNYVIDLPEAPEDTLLDVTWESISSSYTQIRNDFEEIENIFGEYILRKKNPDITDSTHIGSRAFYISFDNYVIRDSVIKYLSEIQGLYDFYYFNRVAIDAGGIIIPIKNKRLK